MSERKIELYIDNSELLQAAEEAHVAAVRIGKIHFEYENFIKHLRNELRSVIKSEAEKPFERMRKHIDDYNQLIKQDIKELKRLNQMIVEKNHLTRFRS